MILDWSAAMTKPSSTTPFTLASGSDYMRVRNDDTGLTVSKIMGGDTTTAVSPAV